MSNPLLFEIKVTATGEVRDKDGNLISSTPVEFETKQVTAEQLAELGLTAPHHPDQEK